MLLIYIREITPRINYIFQLMLEEILALDFELTTDNSFFESSECAKICFHHEQIGDSFWIEPSHLLFEGQLKNYDVEISTWRKLPMLFRTSGRGEIPFDLFAAAFYLVTRYEEYFPEKIDKHGRFRAKHSLAKKHGFLEQPVVNLYAYELKTLLQVRFPKLIFPKQNFTFQPTIDIDNSYAYKHKGVVHNIGSILSKGFKFKGKSAMDHIKVFFHFRKDPYDSYTEQLRVHKKYQVEPVYFFLLGNKSKFDRNLSHKNRAQKKLIRQIDAKNVVGIHPSYASFENSKLIQCEKERLENIVEHEVRKSRQHYIRLKIPQTYQSLIACGIEHDYSMGYPSRIGFRASICSPHFFFDLEKNQTESLRLHPFCIMDTTLKQYMKIRSDKVLRKVKPLFDQIKSVNGEICIVFHNESIGAQGIWMHWKGLYEKIIKLAIS